MSLDEAFEIMKQNGSKIERKVGELYEKILNSIGKFDFERFEMEALHYYEKQRLLDIIGFYDAASDEDFDFYNEELYFMRVMVLFDETGEKIQDIFYKIFHADEWGGESRFPLLVKLPSQYFSQIQQFINDHPRREWSVFDSTIHREGMVLDDKFRKVSHNNPIINFLITQRRFLDEGLSCDVKVLSTGLPGEG